MKTFYRILLLAILSISFPIGRLFEIFIWNNRVTKIEIAASNSLSGVKGKTCSYQSFAGEIKKKVNIHLQKWSDYVVRVRQSDFKIKRLFLTQNNKTSYLRTILIKQFLFNIFYSDDSVSELRHSY
jgi:hypothetical protein